MEKQDNEIIITKLEFPDNVRTRPGMYIGETTNADVLLREIVDNSIDEVYSSKSSADKIWISSNSKYHVVVDNGRGLPIRKSLYDDNVTMAYESISSLHSGSKFNKTESAVGTNGVGSSCVSALSEVYHIWSKITEDKLTRTTEKVKLLCKDTDITDKYYHVKTERGILVEEDVQLRSDIEEITGVPVDPSAMTVVAFNPDLTIFDSRSAQLPDTIRFVKYIVNSRGKSVNIYYNGSEVKESFVPFKYDFICNVNSRYDEARNPSVQFLCSLEIDPSEFKSFNQIGSINGLVVNSGYHIKLSEWAFDLALSKRYSKDFRGYSRWGIHMSTIVMAPEPAFSSQTKERCSGIPGIDQSCLDSLVQRYIQVIDENKEVFDAHVTRVLNYISTLKNLGKLDYIKSKISVVADDTRFGSWTPINLNDCTGTNRRECELFIVEGKSAAGTLLPVRDIRKHAVMKLRGKPMNTSTLDIEHILENQEMRDIINAIGTGVDDYHNTSEVRYGKLITLADQDCDGNNITSLVLGLFASHMKYLIEEGYVYICMTPLYSQKVGKEIKFFYPGEEDQIDWNKPVHRYKGLGSMNSSDMKEFALNPEKRRLYKVTPSGITDGLELLSSTFARTKLLTEVGNIQDKKSITWKEAQG